VVSTFAGHLPPRETPQLLVHQRNELVERGCLAASPREALDESSRRVNLDPF